ncbi:hypothetical protein GLOIN_2v1502410 [Rhizophagus irregularis DAOM 181602=DAOM 197198]|uniref:Uncharacterized protein n=1 Tax=Rhizophagus irregularis (strain DAOM 181602 / DAOM 197198 / MUCL 43194) TaxID=747089 RepID=A0A2P4QWX0_RHIID|nr:hypothetical protein GLOIN_2v1502410 [Rhizophagus irregularis DAOM 181602=DAOM 197198]POG82058.1 hypothetical protein GLOIN_2v1502410 [Rhizophagus irregularis DAOM 181602=DAOM 197198]GET63181.1 hypothetical protein GLOIN_2v1502410 [Rhizophagus irregularis DAOM 181602=DAOM 197198]|eukprot:XP_025188924.1 hypothetical protein GLOIN_2v1502410 [Rhizophagus irregularis DAOM 181602=DAOM 197198]
MLTITSGKYIFFCSQILGIIIFYKYTTLILAILTLIKDIIQQWKTLLLQYLLSKCSVFHNTILLNLYYVKE